jgi:hypothetical protein
MNAYDGSGFVRLQEGDHAAAAAMFRRGLDLFPEHARSLVGLGASLAAQGEAKAAAAAFAGARTAIDALRRGGRANEALLSEAHLHAVEGRLAAAIEALRGLVERTDLPFTGWTIPVEPLLAPVRDLPAYRAIAARLADNAR